MEGCNQKPHESQDLLLTKLIVFIYILLGKLEKWFSKYTPHFLWASLVRFAKETISWQENILALWVVSLQSRHSGWQQVLQ